MSDLISRQAAIDALDGKIEITGRTNAEAVKGYVRLVKDRLERLPSAEQKPLKYSGTSICCYCKTTDCVGCLYEPMAERREE